jgi:hypothetical protein
MILGVGTGVESTENNREVGARMGLYPKKIRRGFGNYIDLITDWRVTIPAIDPLLVTGTQLIPF